MRQNSIIEKDLVLVGAGHANIQVIRSLGMNPIPGLRTTLVSDVLHGPYSGMLPGYLAGWYNFDDVHFDLRKLCVQAGVRFLHGTVSGLDTKSQQFFVEGRPEVSYDLASINVGISPVPLKSEGILKGSLISLKPIGQLLAQWQSFRTALEELHGPTPLRIVVVGAGAAGVEIATILRGVLQKSGKKGEIFLVSRSECPIPQQNPRAQKSVEQSLAVQTIQFIKGQEALEFRGRDLKLSGQTLENIDFVFCATQAQSPDWIRQSVLPQDSKGFLQVDEQLRVSGTQTLFAVGDCSSIENTPLPKAGVYAVRQGPTLIRNLRAQLADEALEPYKPQRRTLFLVTTGKKKALASYGPLHWESPLMWKWKDAIDRKFMETFRSVPPMDSSAQVKGELPENTCGGCGSKVSSQILQRVLQNLRNQKNLLLSEDLGVDDAAMSLQGGENKIQLHNLDGFRSFIDDPYLFGRIGVEHALNDIYAMGGKPQGAQILLAVPPSGSKILERELNQVMSGVAEALTQANVVLSGGHTMEGGELMLGLSVLGDVEKPIPKIGLQQGDLLILTKPLGTGALFAGNMQGAARGEWVEGALDSMLKNQEEALEILREFGVKALTDVTGFGLAGHLLEMLKSQDLGVHLFADQIPYLDGYKDCEKAGHSSFLSKSLKSSYQDQITKSCPSILFDPQTSGGLLGGIPKRQVEACLKKLRVSGYEHAVAIGEVVGKASGPQITMEQNKPEA